MFKKKDPNEGSVLANRIKAVAGSNPDGETEYVDTRIRPNDRAPRQPTYKHATIQLRGGERLSVVVKNISRSGARIEFFRNVALSDVVFLMEPTLKLRTWAEVMWEREGVAGIRFIDS